jgi:hypothetical protein
MFLFVVSVYLLIFVGIIICIKNLVKEKGFVIMSFPIMIGLIILGISIGWVTYLKNEENQRLNNIKDIGYQLLVFSSSDIRNIHEKISRECDNDVLFTDVRYKKVDNLIKADKVFCKNLYRNDEAKEISNKIESIEKSEIKYKIDDILIAYNYERLGRAYNKYIPVCEQKLFIDDLVSEVSEEPFSKYNFYIYCKSDESVTIDKESVNFNEYSVFKDINFYDYTELNQLNMICKDIIYSNGNYYSESVLINTTEVLCQEK